MPFSASCGAANRAQYQLFYFLWFCALDISDDLVTRKEVKHVRDPGQILQLIVLPALSSSRKLFCQTNNSSYTKIDCFHVDA